MKPDLAVKLCNWLDLHWRKPVIKTFGVTRTAFVVMFAPFVLVRYWYFLPGTILLFGLPALFYKTWTPFMWPWAVVSYVVAMLVLVTLRVRPAMHAFFPPKPKA